MNCSCIEEAEKSIVAKQPFKGIKVTKVDIPVSFILGDDSLTTTTYSTVECTVEGRKRPVKKELVHSYCPWCGTSIKHAKGADQDADGHK